MKINNEKFDDENEFDKQKYTKKLIWGKMIHAKNWQQM